MAANRSRKNKTVDKKGATCRNDKSRTGIWIMTSAFSKVAGIIDDDEEANSATFSASGSGRLSSSASAAAVATGSSGGQPASTGPLPEGAGPAAAMSSQRERSTEKPS